MTDWPFLPLVLVASTLVPPPPHDPSGRATYPLTRDVPDIRLYLVSGRIMAIRYYQNPVG